MVTVEHGGSAPAKNATRLMLSLQDASQHCYEFQSARDCAVFRCATALCGVGCSADVWHPQTTGLGPHGLAVHHKCFKWFLVAGRSVVRTSAKACWAVTQCGVLPQLPAGSVSAGVHPGTQVAQLCSMLGVTALELNAPSP